MNIKTLESLSILTNYTNLSNLEINFKFSLYLYYNNFY